MNAKKITKPKILIISGATATGKSDLAVKCALKFGGEIVSCDSMQIYKGMDIGTGKISQVEMRGIPHSMLDIVRPNEEYSVGKYAKDATKHIDDIIARGKLPILVGGTGLYINGILSGWNFAETVANEEVRDRLNKEAEEKGAEYLHEKLASVDPESAEKINIKDKKRIVRALEIFELTGKKKSEAAVSSDCPYDYLFIILDVQRDELYERINNRVDRMLESGLVEEVDELYQYKDFNSMQAIGYKEIIRYLDGEISLTEAVEQVKQGSRRYAKRQITYFKGMKAEKTWVSPENVQEIFALVERFTKTENV